MPNKKKPRHLLRRPSVLMYISLVTGCLASLFLPSSLLPEDLAHTSSDTVVQAAILPLEGTRRMVATDETCSKAPGLEDISPCLPKFLIGGAMMCGTEMTMELIQMHQRITFNTCTGDSNETNCDQENFQGIDYIDRFGAQVLQVWEMQPKYLVSGEKGIRRFLSRLPETDGKKKVTIDQSPMLLETKSHPTFPRAMKQLMPGTKIVFVLCDPVERLAAEYQHYKKEELLQNYFKSEFTGRGLKPPETLEEFFDIITLSSPQCQRDERICGYIRDIYFIKGLYYQSLMDWRKWHNATDILVLDKREAPVDKVRKLTEHANLSLEEYPWRARKTENVFKSQQNILSRPDAVWKRYPESSKRLADMYKESNAALAQLLGEDFPLSWPSTAV